MVRVLAHQGGWDEILLYGTPAILAVFGLRWGGVNVSLTLFFVFTSVSLVCPFADLGVSLFVSLCPSVCPYLT